MHIHLARRQLDALTANNADVGRALEENLWSLWSRFGLAPGCSLHDEADALWFDTPIETLPYNGVLRFTATRDVDRRIDDLIEHYTRRRVPFVWFVHPTTSPADIAERLRGRGLQEVEMCTGMSMALTRRSVLSDIPSGIDIREATSERDRRAVLDLVAWRWNIRPEGVPHLHSIAGAAQLAVPDSALRCWVAWRDGVAVAKVMLYLAAGVAGVYGVATRPEARGLGLAGLLTLEALGFARRAGYGVAVLHATPKARGLYLRIGFHDVAPFRFFASGTIPATWSAGS